MQCLQGASPRQTLRPGNQEALFLQTPVNPPTFLFRSCRACELPRTLARQWYLLESRTWTSDNDFLDLPRLQKGSDHGDMGQPYSARFLRSVHPTAATERTYSVTRSDKARARL